MERSHLFCRILLILVEFVTFYVLVRHLCVRWVPSSISPISYTELRQPSATPTPDKTINEQGVSSATGVLFNGKPFRKKPSMAQLCPAAAGCSEAFGKRASQWISTATACRGTQWAVLTTIHEPAISVRDLVERGDWCVVVVSDLKGPNEYHIPSARPKSILFLNASVQRELAADSDFIASIPWNHFGRKNIGYLIATARGASVIWDFDDDNIITADSFPPPLEHGLLDVLWAPSAGASLGSAKALNVYPFFGCPVSPCWPRGFPLSLIRSNTPARSEWIHGNSSRNVAMLQSLANNDPDVDAIFRLTSLGPRAIQFRPQGSEAGGLPPFVFCPANAQATLHRRDAFWGLLLPMTVSGRVSDIWRSYLLQRLLWDTGLRIAFAPPLARQDRNAHNYLADFQAEQPLYMQTEELLKFLGSWRSSRPTLPERMEELWGAAYERGYLEAADLRSLRLWIFALRSVGYAFPNIDTSTKLSYTEADSAATLTSYTKANPAATTTPQTDQKHQSLNIHISDSNMSNAIMLNHQQGCSKAGKIFMSVNRYGGYNNQLLTFWDYLATALFTNRTFVVPWIYSLPPHNTENINFGDLWNFATLHPKLRFIEAEDLRQCCDALWICSSSKVSTHKHWNIFGRYVGQHAKLPVKNSVDQCNEKKCVLKMSEYRDTYQAVDGMLYDKSVFKTETTQRFPCPKISNVLKGLKWELTPKLNQLKVDILSVFQYQLVGAHLRRGFWHFGWIPWEKVPNGCWPSAEDMARKMALECAWVQKTFNQEICSVLLATDLDAGENMFPGLRVFPLSAISRWPREEQRRAKSLDLSQRLKGLSRTEEAVLEQAVMSSTPTFVGHPCSSTSGTIYVNRSLNALRSNVWRDFHVRNSSWLNMSQCSGFDWADQQEVDERAKSSHDDWWRRHPTSLILQDSESFDIKQLRLPNMSAQHRKHLKGNSHGRRM